ncbi:ADP-ribosylglycohydrolase [Anseongella ginsenosidimutans]|uniref:ADP-ribosylglycohydrolase n=1 Tax=Anseongella ginsenosidimutans TaxID=496056 RepID=A0A4R3KX46_9SPHI|nr:ADP-ribosylglycohydrolase family protein [Anseongella ginsenosidimutans]QEC51325.1 ADP-ribosylglycohydrolase family protein [Anseongella ginsenosidimutans]TCS89981.1 ADP-ribosylglycohydrolase [Anseongella ginsenosidimutans]
MKSILLPALATLCLVFSCSPEKPSIQDKSQISLDKRTLQDKIKGGWAGQTIGVTYGGHTEFKFNGTMIQDYVPVEWDSTSIEWWYDNIPGLYDDVYMDLTFVRVFEEYGLDAPVDSFANAFANASYPLWHANQAARFNILNGIRPPQSGHWMNNPHADDIDFQIEADFAGLMSPGMANTASTISDSIGHIMNYGDGWYGGVYVAAMYSLAFVSDDVKWVVTEALKSIPEGSKYRRCMESVIASYEKYPDDWKQAWFEVERNWSEDLYCPDGVFVPFNIDASLNSAYILIGLLYGEGDFTKTMDIAMRCGQDSDCNPASAAGILGTMIGYDNIPEKYRKALRPVEDRNFAYTDASLNDLYRMSYEQALEVVKRNEGKLSDTAVQISYQAPRPVRLEAGFEGHYPTRKAWIRKTIEQVGSFDFEGKGIIFKGSVTGPEEYVALVDMYIDGKLAESVKLPANHNTRRDEIGFKFNLPHGRHTVVFEWKNPAEGVKIQVTEALVFGNVPVQDKQYIQ